MTTKDEVIRLIQDNYLDVSNQKPTYITKYIFNNKAKKWLNSLYSIWQQKTGDCIEWLEKLLKHDSEEIVECHNNDMKLIVDGKSIQDLGNFWFVPWDTQGMIIKGDEKYRMTGNAPLIVDKQSQEVYITGTAYSGSIYITDFLAFKSNHQSQFTWNDRLIPLGTPI